MVAVFAMQLYLTFDIVLVKIFDVVLALGEVMLLEIAMSSRTGLFVSLALLVDTDVRCVRVLI